MQNFKIDDHMTSSLTEDDIDDGFRMVLPVVSHRRKSLEKERRSRRGRSLSDNGTSSVSSRNLASKFVPLALLSQERQATNLFIRREKY